MSRFLIIGATGQQGGAVAGALAGHRHDITAFVRDPGSPRAQSLAAAGIDLVAGDLDDRPSIEAAFAGMDAAFAVTSPFATSTDVETQQGIAIAEAAASASLPFLVYSSVASADENTGIGHFDSKYRVEQRIDELNVPAAVIAPVFFMENLIFPWVMADYARGVVRQALPADTALQMVSAADIGRAAAHMLQNPAEFTGARVELVGDELTGPQMATVLSSAMGQKLSFERQPQDELAAMGSDMADMYTWFETTGYSADRDALGAALPSVHFASLAEWARRQDWTAATGKGAAS